MEGRLFFVVGPSGSGKDTLLNGARQALAGDRRVVFAPRVITRPAGVGNEDHLPCEPEEFDREMRSGAFLIHWSAHGLKYGIPFHVVDHLASGRHVVVNGSRGAAAELLTKVRNVTLVEISAPAELIAQRLVARGREDAKDVQARLARVTPPLPAGVDTVVIRKQDTANTGDIIVALIDDEEATLKRLRRRGSSIALEAANPAYETRVLGPDRVQIQGRLVSLVRRY